MKEGSPESTYVPKDLYEMLRALRRARDIYFRSPPGHDLIAAMNGEQTSEENRIRCGAEFHGCVPYLPHDRGDGAPGRSGPGKTPGGRVADTRLSFVDNLADALNIGLLTCWPSKKSASRSLSLWQVFAVFSEEVLASGVLMTIILIAEFHRGPEHGPHAGRWHRTCSPSRYESCRRLAPSPVERLCRVEPVLSPVLSPVLDFFHSRC